MLRHGQVICEHFEVVAESVMSENAEVDGTDEDGGLCFDFWLPVIKLSDTRRSVLRLMLRSRNFLYSDKTLSSSMYSVVSSFVLS